jgi:predicted phosphodiesterase
MRARNMSRVKAECQTVLASMLIGAVLIAWLNGCGVQRDEGHFYFVQITDTHFEDGDNLKRTREVVDCINALPMRIECVVHTGDITTDLIEDRMLMDLGLSVLERLAVPIHYVAGNHDILPEKLESTRNAYVERFGGLISQAEYNNVVFVFVYTEPLGRWSFVTPGYRPLERLEACLKESKGKPVIVFHHAPSVDSFYDNEFHKRWEEGTREKWAKLLNAYNVKAVIAGHFHKDEHHWLGDIPLYVCAPVAGRWGRQATFRIYEYHNGRIGYRTQYIE